MNAQPKPTSAAISPLPGAAPVKVINQEHRRGRYPKGVTAISSARRRRALFQREQERQRRQRAWEEAQERAEWARNTSNDLYTLSKEARSDALRGAIVIIYREDGSLSVARTGCYKDDKPQVLSDMDYCLQCLEERWGA